MYKNERKKTLASSIMKHSEGAEANSSISQLGAADLQQDTSGKLYRNVCCS